MTLQIYIIKFHVSLLKPYRSDGRIQPAPPAHIMDGEEEYEVEQILAHRLKGKGTEFLIKWMGYGPEHNTWEPEANVEHAPEKLADYWKRVREGHAAKPIGLRRRHLSRDKSTLPSRKFLPAKRARGL